MGQDCHCTRRSGPLGRRCRGAFRWARTGSSLTVKMRRRVRKGVLAIHILFAVGWVGGVIAYLALVAGAWRSSSSQMLRAAWIGMELIGWYVLVPLAIGTLVTGIVMGVGTHWGLFRYYWVVFSLVLTIIAAGVLFGHMPTVSSVADIANASPDPAREALFGEVLHAGGGLIVLLCVLGLNVFKPPGLTPYGHRTR